MDAIKFIKEKGRMCKGCEHCSECPIGKVKGKDHCDYWEFDHPTETISIIARWSREHPEKTILDDFLEKYPNAQISDKGIPKMCPYDLGYGDSCPDIIRFDCVTCWNRSLSEVE